VYIAFIVHILVVLYLRKEIMKERDTKKCLSMFTSFPSTSQVISLNDGDSVPKLSRKHSSATTRLTLGNPCTAILLQSVQMCLAITDSSARPRRQAAIPNSSFSHATQRSVQESVTCFFLQFHHGFIRRLY